jgi:hypothetical protein
VIVVVDVGCKSHEAERSIEPLIERFRPEILFGFDPHPMLEEGFTRIGGTIVVTRKMAAWTFDGSAPFRFDGSRSRVRAGPDSEPVRCFDLARWIDCLPGCDLAVKVDIEGGEYLLLEHLLERDVDGLIGTLLVEWHGADDGGLSDRLACPVEAWLP